MTSESPVAPPMPPRTGPLPITVLCGFLGSGKTTLLKKLLRDGGDRRFAVVVNDLSELEVDAELVQTAREGHGDRMLSLHSGSLGGALREKLRTALTHLEGDVTVDYLLIETSGGTHPTALVSELAARSGSRLDTFATVVDGLNVLRDFDAGQALLSAEAISTQPALALLLAQIAAASVLLISKADQLQRSQAEAIIRVLQQLNPRATVITMAYGAVKPEHLLDARTFRPRKAASPAHDDDPAAYDLGSDVLRDPRPFHPQRLHELFTQRLGLGIYRSKGWLWLASRPADVLVWNQAGSWFGLEFSGTWKASILADPAARLLPEEIAALRTRLADTHPVFGDRGCELTVIGTACDRAVFLDDLRSCLCTDEESAAWQRGEAFPDPWPKTFRKI